MCSQSDHTDFLQFQQREGVEGETLVKETCKVGVENHFGGNFVFVRSIFVLQGPFGWGFFGSE